MNKKLFIFSLVIVFVFTISIASFARAEEVAVPTLYADEGAPVPTLINEEGVDLEGAELGEVEEVELPSAFSRWFRNARESINLRFTFDDVKKAEKQLEYAERKIQLADAFSAKGENPQAQEIAVKLVEQAEQYAVRIEERKEKLLEKVDERKIRFMEKFAEHKVQRERVLEKLEDRVPVERLKDVQTMRKRIEVSNEKSIEVLDSNTNIPEDVKSRIMQQRAVVDDIRKERELIREDFQVLIQKVEEGEDGAVDALREERIKRLEELNAVRKEGFQEARDMLGNTPDPTRTSPPSGMINEVRVNVDAELSQERIQQRFKTNADLGTQQRVGEMIPDEAANGRRQ